MHKSGRIGESLALAELLSGVMVWLLKVIITKEFIFSFGQLSGCGQRALVDMPRGTRDAPGSGPLFPSLAL